MSDVDIVSLQVNSSQKEGWEEFVEEFGELQSLSHLIRLAVEKEINGDAPASTKSTRSTAKR